MGRGGEVGERGAYFFGLVRSEWGGWVVGYLESNALELKLELSFAISDFLCIFPISSHGKWQRADFREFESIGLFNG